MDRTYAAQYRELFEKHWWWRARSELIVETLRRLQPREGWKRILDIGCGDGLFFPQLRQFGEVEGVEPDAEMVAADNPDRANIYIGGFDANFQPSHKYSLIVMLDVLEHLRDPVAALRGVRDLLESDGTFLITVPAFMLLWTNHDALNHHFTRYTQRQFRSVAEQAGLRVTEQRYFYHWTFPAKLAVRVYESAFHVKPRPAQVPSTGVNSFLFSLSRFEQKMLGRISFPLGSSLMAIGKLR